MLSPRRHSLRQETMRRSKALFSSVRRVVAPLVPSDVDEITRRALKDAWKRHARGDSLNQNVSKSLKELMEKHTGNVRFLNNVCETTDKVRDTLGLKVVDLRSLIVKSQRALEALYFEQDECCVSDLKRRHADLENFCTELDQTLKDLLKDFKAKMVELSDAQKSQYLQRGFETFRQISSVGACTGGLAVACATGHWLYVPASFGMAAVAICQGQGCKGGSSPEAALEEAIGYVTRFIQQVQRMLDGTVQWRKPLSDDIDEITSAMKENTGRGKKTKKRIKTGMENVAYNLFYMLMALDETIFWLDAKHYYFPETFSVRNVMGWERYDMIEAEFHKFAEEKPEKTHEAACSLM